MRKKIRVLTTEWWLVMALPSRGHLDRILKVDQKPSVLELGSWGLSGGRV